MESSSPLIFQKKGFFMTKRLCAFSLILSLMLSLLCGCISLPEGFGGASSAVAETSEVAPPIDPEGDFQIHFIDVGQADAALVICDGKTMLIDGGNKEDSNLIYSYLTKRGISYLDYVVCTHAHEDHVGGLAGALTAADAGVVMAPVTQYDSKAFSDFVQKAADRGKTLTVPKAGDVFSLGSSVVTILGPVKEYEDPNNTSIVLRIVYGETSFLFTGDMETVAETDLIESGAYLRSTLLKVGHHGSSTSTSYRFLREVAPTYGIISVGKDNSYGHPNESVLSRLSDAEVIFLRTDEKGDIICTGDGKTLTFTTSKGGSLEIEPPAGELSTDAVTEYPYIGNLNSKKYHHKDCSSLPGEENRIYFTSQAEAEEKGYTACGICKP